MPLGDEFTAVDGLWVALSVFLIIVGVGLFFVLLRLAGAARRLTSLLQGLEAEALPLINKISGTVDRVNKQLDKADVVTDSAVSAVTAIDKTVRAVTRAVSWPVQKLSALTAGLSHGASSLRVDRDVGRAYETGREAAVRRERDVSEELSQEPGTPDA